MQIDIAMEVGGLAVISSDRTTVMTRESKNFHPAAKPNIPLELLCDYVSNDDFREPKCERASIFVTSLKNYMAEFLRHDF